MTKKTFVCLADSFRPGGSCVAGIEVIDGNFAAWVRPVSKRQDQAISDYDKTYEDGTKLAMLDIVSATFKSHQPEHHQSENWLIDDGVWWSKIGTVTKEQMKGAVLPSTTPLWGPAQSTFTGHNDQVSGETAHSCNWSLALINPTTAIVDVFYNKFSEDNEVWVSFIWANTRHKMKLTDPVMFAQFNTKIGDSYTLEQPLLSISLAHVWAKKNTASKLVAGLIL